MIWHEDALKHLVHLNPNEAFGRRVQIVDLDTKKTPEGRADVVLLDDKLNLVVCELERKLDNTKIAHHALIEQAWAYGRHLYWHASYGNLIRLYRTYYKRYCDPTGTVPSIQEQLGVSEIDLNAYPKSLVVVVGAWQVDDQVYDIGTQLAEQQAEVDRDKAYPCEVQIMEIRGRRDRNIGMISIDGTSRVKSIFRSGKCGTSIHCADTLPTNQHVWSRDLSSRFAEVDRKLPQYLPQPLRGTSKLYTKVRFENDIASFFPWGLKIGVQFSISTKYMHGSKVEYCPHFELYAEKRLDLCSDLTAALQAEKRRLINDFACSADEVLIGSQTKYPIKQDNVDFSSSEAIAKGFGNFISAVYPIILPYVW
ncbi:MAG: hypothetical protein ABFD54_13055 [Armatimonadota bacterium]|nr:hypothetical protein [bacterium]